MKVRHPHYNRRPGLPLFFLLVLAGACAPLQASDYGIIDDVRISSSTQGPQIRVLFNQSAQYVSHTPETEGRQIFIDLRLIGATPDEFPVPQQQQLHIRPTTEVPLTTVSYREEALNRARLELDFKTTVRYRVSASSNFRGVTITLIGAKAALPLPVSKPELQASPEVEKRVATLMGQARTALVDERDFARAVTLYQQVLNQPANSRSREALELLGLARERLGQRAQAKAIYDDYLKRYPSGEGSERVRQRLMSLLTAALPEREKLRQAQPRADWDVYGSFSQFYLQDSVRFEDAPPEATVSALTTDIDLVALYHGSGNSDTRMRITAGHYYDRLAKQDDSRVNALYAEHRNRDTGLWARAGRQSSDHDGVLGHFDGLKLGYALSKRLEATVVAGYTVDSSRDPLNQNRSFAGAALNLGPFADNWEFTFYGIEQKVEELVDRRALGGELRYFRPDLTVFGLTDYDLFYRELNIGMLLANWTLKNELTLNATVDVRKLPTLTTRNALIGQTIGPATAPVPVADIAQLLTLYDEDTIYQLARDRTAEIRTLTLGASRPISEKLRIAGDLTVLHIGATPASPIALGNVAAIPATDNEFSFHIQGIGTGLIKGDDISSIGLNYANATSLVSVGLFAGSRLPVGRGWSFYPRLRIDYRTLKETDDTQLSLSPVLRVEYRWNRLSFQGELGGEWVNRQLPDGTERTQVTYGSIGYRYEF